MTSKSGTAERVKIASLFENSTAKYSIKAPSTSLLTSCLLG